MIHYVYNEAGSIVVTYTYDAWGNTISATGNSTLIGVNPIRYKSYYYDSETGFFYLQSRYYDPQVGRFINADEVDYLGASGTVLGCNLFAYCENEPITHSDAIGCLTWPGQIHNYVQLVLTIYILATYGKIALTNYYIKMGKFKFGLADLYVKDWNEVWEVKPDKQKYYKSGPAQLKKYIDNLSGSRAGRNLGKFTTYYLASEGIYEVIFRSNTSDGMIYYEYHYCWNILLYASILFAGGIIIYCTGGTALLALAL
ncbi:MAG: RHS repeat-associated core domain-containing protein [Eubacteriales bacterium]